jgi:hypothetical protein
MRVVSVAAVAAFVAAGFSLVGVVVNVVLNARLTGRSKRQEWRRDYVLPIVTEILFIEERLSFNAQAVKLNESATDGQQETLSIRDQIAKDIDELGRKVKELELTASSSVSHAAGQLYINVSTDLTSALFKRTRGRRSPPPRPGSLDIPAATRRGAVAELPERIPDAVVDRSEHIELGGNIGRGSVPAGWGVDTRLGRSRDHEGAHDGAAPVEFEVFAQGRKPDATSPGVELLRVLHGPYQDALCVFGCDQGTV